MSRVYPHPVGPLIDNGPPEAVSSEPGTRFYCYAYKAELTQCACVERQFAVTTGKNGVGKTGVAQCWKTAAFPHCALSCVRGARIAERLPDVVRGRKRCAVINRGRHAGENIKYALQEPDMDYEGGTPPIVTYLYESWEERDRLYMEQLTAKIRENQWCRSCQQVIALESLTGFCSALRCQRYREDEKQAIRDGRAIPLVYRPTPPLDGRIVEIAGAVTLMAGHRASPGPRDVAAVPFRGSAPRRSEGADRGTSTSTGSHA